MLSRATRKVYVNIRNEHISEELLAIHPGAMKSICDIFSACDRSSDLGEEEATAILTSALYSFRKVSPVDREPEAGTDLAIQAMARRIVEPMTHSTEAASKAVNVLMKRGRLEDLLIDSKANAILTQRRAVTSLTADAQALLTLTLSLALVSRLDSVEESAFSRELSAASTLELCQIGAIFAHRIASHRPSFTNDRDYKRREFKVLKNDGGRLGKFHGYDRDMTDGLGLGLARSEMAKIPSHKPRRILVGRIDFNPAYKSSATSFTRSTSFDVAIEWDRWQDPSEALAPSAWTTPGFRLLFTQNKKTIAYILTEVVAPNASSMPPPTGLSGASSTMPPHSDSSSASSSATSAASSSTSPSAPCPSASRARSGELKLDAGLHGEPLVWALRGMAVVDDAWRGKSLSRTCLNVWLLMCWKVRGLSSKL